MPLICFRGKLEASLVSGGGSQEKEKVEVPFEKMSASEKAEIIDEEIVRCESASGDLKELLKNIPSGYAEIGNERNVEVINLKEKPKGMKNKFEFFVIDNIQKMVGEGKMNKTLEDIKNSILVDSAKKSAHESIDKNLGGLAGEIVEGENNIKALKAKFQSEISVVEGLKGIDVEGLEDKHLEEMNKLESSKDKKKTDLQERINNHPVMKKERLLSEAVRDLSELGRKVSSEKAELGNNIRAYKQAIKQLSEGDIRNAVKSQLNDASVHLSTFVSQEKIIAQRLDMLQKNREEIALFVEKIQAIKKEIGMKDAKAESVAPAVKSEASASSKQASKSESAVASKGKYKATGEVPVFVVDSKNPNRAKKITKDGKEETVNVYSTTPEFTEEADRGFSDKDTTETTTDLDSSEVEKEPVKKKKAEEVPVEKISKEFPKKSKKTDKKSEEGVNKEAMEKKREVAFQALPAIVEVLKEIDSTNKKERDEKALFYASYFEKNIDSSDNFKLNFDEVREAYIEYQIKIEKRSQVDAYKMANKKFRKEEIDKIEALLPTNK